MEEEGYKRGAAAPTVFYNEATKGRCVVHGDDFTCLAPKGELERMKAKMQEWYDIKDRGTLAEGVGELQKISMLQKTIFQQKTCFLQSTSMSAP